MIKLKAALGAITLAIISASAVAVEWQALPAKAPEPADNPGTPAKVELGKMLYHDVRLSSNGVLSCNSCHNVMSGGEDNRAGSIGVRNQVGGQCAYRVEQRIQLCTVLGWACAQPGGSGKRTGHQSGRDGHEELG